MSTEVSKTNITTLESYSYILAVSSVEFQHYHCLATSSCPTISAVHQRIAFETSNRPEVCGRYFELNSIVTDLA